MDFPARHLSLFGGIHVEFRRWSKNKIASWNTRGNFAYFCSVFERLPNGSELFMMLGYSCEIWSLKQKMINWSRALKTCFSCVTLYKTPSSTTTPWRPPLVFQNCRMRSIFIGRSMESLTFGMILMVSTAVILGDGWITCRFLQNIGVRAGGGGVNLKKIHKTTDDTTSFCSQTFSLFVTCLKIILW